MDPSFMPSRKSFERAGTELIFLINIKEIEREREIYIIYSLDIRKFSENKHGFVLFHIFNRVKSLKMKSSL